MVKQKDLRVKQIVVYIITIVLSIVFIIVGRNLAMQGYPDWGAPESTSYSAAVTEIVSVTETDSGQEIVFAAQLKSGPYKGSAVQGLQTINYNYYPVQEPVEKGSKILVYPDSEDDTTYIMLEYMRSNAIIVLGVIFALALVLFGHIKGLNTLISLVFTCLAVFVVFLPSVLSGKNIYLWSIMVCVYVIVMTMLVINGLDKKSFVAGAGCLAGVILAGVLTLIMDGVLHLTGMTTEDTLYLQMLDLANPIDLKGIIFASIIIGSMGAIMDVAMDIASSLRELSIHSPELSSRQLINSGFNIGRDVMGTMANTLVLAYIGSSLTTTILMVAYNVTMIELFNMELIIVELLQALVGSIGILLAIPVTSIIGAVIYVRKKDM